jgi:hypothetical protein
LAANSLCFVVVLVLVVVIGFPGLLDYDYEDDDEDDAGVPGLFGHALKPTSRAVIL